MTSSLLRCCSAAFFALVAFPALSFAQDLRIVTGTVIDSAGQPISYVSIDGGPRYRTLTNASGEWSLKLPPKESIEVAIRRIGYLPGQVRVLAGSDTTIAVSLQRLAVLLTTQVVRAQQQVRTLETRGFYSRMLDNERGALVGEFVMPEEIEMRNPQRVTQLLEQRRGLSVRRAGNCQVITTCYRVYGQGGCAATIYLDNQRLNKLAGGEMPAIDELIPVTGVSAIEVYPRGSAAPPRFQALAGTCSIVVIWTK
jgi:hypothetical protein